MKKTNLKKLFSAVLCMALIVAMALITTGCGQKNEDDRPNTLYHTEVFEDGAVIGSGEKEFGLTVVDKEGNRKNFTVKTDMPTVGEALLEYKVIRGEDGPYGLYIKEVNGIAADYDTDKVYWAFYINDSYAVSGIELTEIENSGRYRLKVEK